MTVLEMLIVLAIIGILMMIGMIPYGEYLRREALSITADTFANEWIMAHKEIRNGILFPEADATGKKSHASLVVVLKK